VSARSGSVGSPTRVRLDAVETPATAGSTRVLLASLVSDPERPELNVSRHVETLELAAAEDCRLAVFPEFSLTGPVDPAVHQERAVTTDCGLVSELVAATHRLGTAAVFGIAERAGDSFHITQLYAAEGALAGRYRKRHLGVGEDAYVPGTEPAVFAIEGRRFGIVICAESTVDFTWNDIASAGASLVLFCAAPGLYGRRNDDSGWREGLSWWEESGLGDARRQAAAHKLWVGVATLAGSTAEEDFPGLAALVDTDGNVVSRTADWHPGTLVVDVPPAGPSAASPQLTRKAGQGDIWFEWLTRRRQGGSAEQQQVVLERLAPVRDAVVANAGISEGDTVLDVGAGDGLIAFAALEKVGEAGVVIFSDVSRDLLDHAAATAEELNVADRCRFVLAPADDLSPFADGSVDVVTTRSVLIYVKDKAASFREFHRVLRPGGRISIYEPVNRLMCLSNRLWSYDVSPVAGLHDKLRQLFDTFQDPVADPMIDFGELDLLAFAEQAGFAELHLELRVDVEPEPPTAWEAFVNSSGNPLVPTLREAMDEVLTGAEAAELEAYLRPLVENGGGQRRLAGAFLRATKAAGVAGRPRP
jgi:arsenite methyltransferase